MTLKEKVENAKAEYAKRGHDEKSWQWNDEGIVYAIQDYLSSCEMTAEDWEYAVRICIEDIIHQLNEE